MKKIINGKKYDTNTAKEICIYSNGFFSNDVRFCTESLFRKKTGEFFLYGCGGAMSKYAVSYGNSTSGSETIIPLKENEAKKWCEENLDADEYEKIFGEVEE